MDILLFLVPSVVAILLLIWVGYIAMKQRSSFVAENQRAVVLRWGKFIAVAGRGQFTLLPFLDRPIPVNLDKYFKNWQSLTEDEIRSKVKDIVFQEQYPAQCATKFI